MALALGVRARGRHVRRSSLVAWLFAMSLEPAQPTWRAVHAQSLVLLTDDVAGLRLEVGALRGAAQSATARAVSADLRVARVEAELAATRGELDRLRAELAAVREELVWAFAERRLPAAGAVPLARPRPVADAG